MTLHSPMRPDGVAHHQHAMSGWTTTWKDGPPSDWDEIRDRLRSLHAPKGGRAKEARATEPRVLVATAPPAVATPAMETLDGPHPARVSWRRADVATPAWFAGVLTRLRDALACPRLPRWWREHDPLLMQRVLLLVNALLVVVLVLQLV